MANRMRPSIKALAAMPLLIATAAFPQPREFNGKWLANTIVSTGVVGDRYWERVSLLIGSTILIDGSQIRFATGETCELLEQREELWANDMATFGSFGGNWGQLGLRPADNGQNFEVIAIPIQCGKENEPELTLVTQNKVDILLLGAFRVFATLQKSSN